MSIIQYQVVRSNRKSIALVIDSDANLIVRAPLYSKDSEIAVFVEKKKRWITEKQHQVSTFGEKHSPVIIETGESILYLGNTYTILKDNVSDIQLSSTNILIPYEYSVNDVINWLKGEAEIILTERVGRYASMIGVNYSSINLSDAKTRWGSCSAKGNLNFAWRLVMCPMAVIDYVVVHELSHIDYCLGRNIAS